MLFDNFKNYFIVRYNIYDFLKIVSEVPHEKELESVQNQVSLKLKKSCFHSLLTLNL